MSYPSHYEDYSPRRPQPSTSVWPFVVLLGLLLLAGGLVVWYWTHRQAASGQNPDAKSLPVASREHPLLTDEQTNIKIYKDTSPSVVHVTNLAESRGQFSLNVERVPQGTGSGFVWDKDGHIVTNFHVVKDASAVQVTLADQSTYDADQVWVYPEKDIAVIWVRAPRGKLHPIRLGTSHDLKVGQKTYAIGNPFGLDHTMTTGIVSALGREINESATRMPIQGVIQTSAAINPGNSGGPLFDSDGRLIGMTTAIVSPSGAFAGIGFAIPADEINRVVPQLVSHGKIVRPKLGVQVAEDELARQLGVDEGALVIKVQPGSPAERAGLQGTRRDEEGRLHLGDIITAVGDKAVQRGKDLFAALEQYKVSDTVRITFIRDGERRQVNVQLQARE
jgi:S1-C subfamily serine protease